MWETSSCDIASMERLLGEGNGEREGNGDGEGRAKTCLPLRRSSRKQTCREGVEPPGGTCFLKRGGRGGGVGGWGGV